MKKKILVITSSFPRNTSDWWAQFVCNIYRYMDKTMYDVTVLAPHAPGSKLTEKMYGFQVIRYPYFYPLFLEKLTSGSGILHSSSENVFARLQIIPFIVMEFAYTVYLSFTNKYSIIHAHWILPQGFIGGILKILFKVKLLVTVHGSDIFGLQKYNTIKKITLTQADWITVNSIATFEETKRFVEKEKIQLIPMGVDINRFKPGKKNTGGKYILAVGRLIKCKGFDYLIISFANIIKKNPKIFLKIVGEGPERSRLTAIIKEYHLEKYVTLVGSKNHEELATLYSQAQIFVAPSIKDPTTGETEGQGIVVLEAMASGTPVIVSNSGGLQYMVKEGKSGYIVKERDVKELSKTILSLLKDDKKRSLFAQNGLMYVKKKYNWYIIAKLFEKVYKDLSQ